MNYSPIATSQCKQPTWNPYYVIWMTTLTTLLTEALVVQYSKAYSRVTAVFYLKTCCVRMVAVYIQSFSSANFTFYTYMQECIYHS